MVLMKLEEFNQEIVRLGQHQLQLLQQVASRNRA
jgi:hypothetical protein